MSSAYLLFGVTIIGMGVAGFLYYQIIKLKDEITILKRKLVDAGII